MNPKFTRAMQIFAGIISLLCLVGIGWAWVVIG